MSAKNSFAIASEELPQKTLGKPKSITVDRDELPRRGPPDVQQGEIATQPGNEKPETQSDSQSESLSRP